MSAHQGAGTRMPSPEPQVSSLENCAVSDVKKEIESLAAESFALQLVLLALCHRLGETNAAFRAPILQAFDDAADRAEKFSFSVGEMTGHLPETLKVVEQMRAILMSQIKPKREV